MFCHEFEVFSRVGYTEEDPTIVGSIPSSNERVRTTNDNDFGCSARSEALAGG
jgi:hypothetical protein